MGVELSAYAARMGIARVKLCPDCGPQAADWACDHLESDLHLPVELDSLTRARFGYNFRSMCHRIGIVGFLLTAAMLVSGNARGEEIKARFLENGQQTLTVRPDQPGTLLIVNPSSHRFRCTHLTEGLRVVATPAKDIDVTLQIESQGRRRRAPIDRGGPGDAERYDEHPPLGTTTIHIQVKSTGGEVLVSWTWDPRCHERTPSPTRPRPPLLFSPGPASAAGGRGAPQR